MSVDTLPDFAGWKLQHVEIDLSSWQVCLWLYLNLIALTKVLPRGCNTCSSHGLRAQFQ